MAATVTPTPSRKKTVIGVLIGLALLVLLIILIPKIFGKKVGRSNSDHQHLSLQMSGNSFSFEVPNNPNKMLDALRKDYGPELFRATESLNGFQVGRHEDRLDSIVKYNYLIGKEILAQRQTNGARPRRIIVTNHDPSLACMVNGRLLLPNDTLTADTMWLPATSDATVPIFWGTERGTEYYRVTGPDNRKVKAFYTGPKV